MLSARDRIFLKDYADLAAKNRLYTALALQSVMAAPHELAAQFGALDALHDLELVTEAQRRSEAGRLQVICQAKIFAEMVAAYEDFGALCHSVLTRGQNEIVVGYLRCGVGSVDGFFRGVLKSPSQTMDSLLRLPSLERVMASVPDSIGAVLRQSYAELPEIIASVARHYDTLPDVSFATVLGRPESDWREKLHIFVQARPASHKPMSSASHQRRVFERIKHRFVVLGRAGDYPLDTDQHEIHGVAYPRSQAFVDDMIMHLDVTTLFARDLPYMLLNLDDHDLM